ncbi:MAG: hypothetical protein JRI96_16675 [Deltaproteobacteria bacterium]|nr:hypothetical protein [Deltaproteobacteria bacterium]
MKKETPVDFRAFLKGQKAIPPGIEYFFIVRDGKGRVFTFPESPSELSSIDILQKC